MMSLIQIQVLQAATDNNNLMVSKGTVIITMLNFLTGTIDMNSSNEVHNLGYGLMKVISRGTHLQHTHLHHQ